MAKDYNLRDLREVMAPLVADVVQTWLERAEERRTVVFCVDIKHSAFLTREFKAHGVAAEHVDANTPSSERDEIYARFRSGETQVLCNCMLASYANFPATYEAARRALEECVKIDECKSWSNRSVALATYAKMARDKGLLRLTKQVYALAARRMGELLAEIEVPKFKGNQYNRSGEGGRPP